MAQNLILSMMFVLMGTILLMGMVSAELTKLDIVRQYEAEYLAYQDRVTGDENALKLVPPAVWKYLQFPEPVYDEDGEVRPHCPTDRLWEAFSVFYRKIGITLQNGCKAETICDEPDVRDEYLPQPDGQKVTVDVAFHVICSSATSCPDNMDLQRVLGQMETLNEDFETANVAFDLQQDNIFFHVDPNLSTIAAYSFAPTWYNQIREVKHKYAYKPSQFLNIFVTGQKKGIMGTLLGIGTFPWDPEALTNYGGLWLNAVYTGPNERTLSHEAGHNVGLWHSFHGVEEVGKCGSACYEYPHPLDDENANYVGDFCADTPAQPTNYDCKVPSGDACNGVAWNAYGNSGLLFNIMSYHADDCLESFTLSQAARAGCYLCTSVPSLLTTDGC